MFAPDTVYEPVPSTTNSTPGQICKGVSITATGPIIVEFVTSIVSVCSLAH